MVRAPKGEVLREVVRWEKPWVVGDRWLREAAMVIGMLAEARRGSRGARRKAEENSLTMVRRRLREDSKGFYVEKDCVIRLG
jgi:hypothetical protein